MLKRGLVLVLLIVVFLVTSRSLFLGKLYFLHDFTHAARIAEMTRGLQDGDFPVLWSKNFGYGYGMPLFLFYGPLPYYFGAIVYLFSNSMIWSVLSLFILSNLITIGGSYLLGKEISGRTGGLILSALYTLAPYRAVNIFVRGALNEVWAMAFLPWLMLGWLLLVKKNRFGWLTISLSTAAIILSHNLSALFFLPFSLIAGWCFLLWFGQTKNTTIKDKSYDILSGIFSTLLGIGLSAFYALPAVIEKSFTRLDRQVLTGYFDYHNHFLYLRQFLLDQWNYGGSAWGPEDGISFFLGYGILFGLSITIIWLVSKKQQKISANKMIALFILLFVVGVLVLLTTQKTLWVWEHFSILKYLQFPWRLVSLITFIASIVITLIFTHRFKYRSIFILLLIIITLITSFRYFVPAQYYESSIGPYYYEASSIQTYMSGILPDYLPTNFNEQIDPYQNIVSDTDLVKFNILKDANTEKLIALEAKQPMPVTISLAYFPGWQAYIDGQLTLISSNDDGLIQANIPQGKHLLSLIFINTADRNIGCVISGFSVLILMIGLIVSQKKLQLK